MSFIKAQKIVRDESGHITSGSAAIVDTKYVASGTKNHCVHSVREKLGKVLYLSDDKKRGIFLSPTRGLVEYSSVDDCFTTLDADDERITQKNIFSETQIHTVFGDSYLLLSFLKNSGLLAVLRSVFPKDDEYQRLLAHILHGVLRDGSKISCDNFIGKSFASYVLSSVPITSLHSDTTFYKMMGADDVKMAFFKKFIEAMKKVDPDFGKGCYVDSTPLPNDIVNNPFNALCSHGVASTDFMSRMILVLDEKTGLPVWYDIIPGNVLDVNTIMNTVNEVADTLGVEISSLVLDAGYVSEELVHCFPVSSEKKIIARMPARKGYPFKTLYWSVKELIPKGKYVFIRKSHTYFGLCKEIELFGEKMYAYVYVDKQNALKHFSDWLLDHEDEYSQMKVKDQDWQNVRFGYFVLVSNFETDPQNLLTEYFGRTDIEVVFKTSKEYLDLLPLSKWSDETVRGKILQDMIDTIVLLNLRKQLAKTNANVSTSEIFGRTQSLMCFRNNAGMVTVETPNKQVKSRYNLCEISIPAHVNIATFKKDVLTL